MQESSDVAIARDKTGSERHAQKPTNFTLKEHWFNRFCRALLGQNQFYEVNGESGGPGGPT